MSREERQEALLSAAIEAKNLTQLARAVGTTTSDASLLRAIKAAEKKPARGGQRYLGGGLQPRTINGRRESWDKVYVTTTTSGERPS